MIVNRSTSPGLAGTGFALQVLEDPRQARRTVVGPLLVPLASPVAPRPNPVAAPLSTPLAGQALREVVESGATFAVGADLEPVPEPSAPCQDDEGDQVPEGLVEVLGLEGGGSVEVKAHSVPGDLGHHVEPAHRVFIEAGLAGSGEKRPHAVTNVKGFAQVRPGQPDPGAQQAMPR